MKEDQLKKLKEKAELKNDDEFYFKMLKGKRNEEGKFIEDSDSDSDFDEKDYRASLKTENYGIVRHQRSMVQKVFDQRFRKYKNYNQNCISSPQTTK